MNTVTLRQAGFPPFAGRDDLACKTPGLDPNIFFPDESDKRWRLAKRYCRGCPVRDECLLWALPIRDLAGVWGATTAIDRDRIRRQHRIARLDWNGTTIVGITVDWPEARV